MASNFLPEVKTLSSLHANMVYTAGKETSSMFRLFWILLKKSKRQHLLV